ncbi:hypothetical protein SNEBB_000290 [Seison nebaliae]|nr:hypothetical protein SNEBB_000290 [Seison nebaliae]
MNWINSIIFYFIIPLNLCRDSLQQFSASSKTHTNNWAVLIDTSRFWFNYRHVANVLSIYHSVKRLGIPDSNIILMVADDVACNARNTKPATVFNNMNQQIDVFGNDAQIDYRGEEVTVKNFIRVLTGRVEEDTAKSRRLLSDENSNILIYMTGHGGDGFIKFQDATEISSIELADVIEQMWQKGRYNQLFFMADTCQAESLYLQFYSPNVLAFTSSKVGEDSFSHHVDPTIGVYIIDRFTYFILQFLQHVTISSKLTMQDLFDVCHYRDCRSQANHRTDLHPINPSKIPLLDFFSATRSIEWDRSLKSIPSNNIDEMLKQFESKNEEFNRRFFDDFNHLS